MMAGVKPVMPSKKTVKLIQCIGKLLVRKRCHVMGEEGSFVGAFEASNTRLIFYLVFDGIPYPRTVVAKCIHRIRRTSERNIETTPRSSRVSMNDLSRLKVSGKRIGEKIMTEFVHESACLKFMNVINI